MGTHEHQESLVDKARSGDQDALAKLFESNRDGLERMVQLRSWSVSDFLRCPTTSSRHHIHRASQAC